MTPGETVVAILDKFWRQEQRPLVIVETGCLRAVNPDSEAGDGWSTLRIVEWLGDSSKGHLWSVDIDPQHLEVAINVLRERSLLDGRVTFMCEESVDALNNMHHIDFAYLDTSDGLNHGLAEFQAAEASGARVIVMDDIATKAALAINYAVDHGWKCTLEDRLAVMRR
jgi:predicted O-methyltransferase YrrM